MLLEHAQFAQACLQIVVGVSCVFLVWPRNRPDGELYRNLPLGLKVVSEKEYADPPGLAMVVSLKVLLLWIRKTDIPHLAATSPAARSPRSRDIPSHGGKVDVVTLLNTNSQACYQFHKSNNLPLHIVPLA